MLQALDPAGLAAGTIGSLKRTVEIDDAVNALRGCLRDEHSNLIQVGTSQLWGMAPSPLC
jgi:hypothetical protein